VTQYFKTIHVRQLQIADRQMMAALIEQFDGGRSGSGGVDRVSFLNEVLPQRIGHRWLVVYHQNPHFFVLHLFLLPRNRCALGHNLTTPASIEWKLYHKFLIHKFCRPAVGLDDLCRECELHFVAAGEGTKRIAIQLTQAGPLDRRSTIVEPGGHCNLAGAVVVGLPVF